MSYGKEWFSAVLQMETGDRLAINCNSKEEMNSLRVQLYRERTNYAKINPEDAGTISISAATKGGRFAVLIKKEVRPTVGVLFKASGEVISVKPEAQQRAVVPDPSFDDWTVIDEQLKEKEDEDGLQPIPGIGS